MVLAGFLTILVGVEYLKRGHTDMVSTWTERERDTNRLARALAEYVFAQSDITSRQLYGLSKLAWITNSYAGDNPAYIKSTKIPALCDVLQADFSNANLEEVALKVVRITSQDSVGDSVLRHSGFTNFYKAYRNSVALWIEEHFQVLLPMYSSAFHARTRSDRRALVEQIMTLKPIPIGNEGDRSMRPEFFLTPAFFVLDPEIKFPLINGNKNVRTLLRKLRVSRATLVEQFDALYGLYGQGGIVDAADVDSLGEDLPEFIGSNAESARMGIPRASTGLQDEELPFIDASDVASVKQGGTVRQRRIHNQLRNKLLECLEDRFLLREGRSDECMFDVMVKEFDGENDLLIEVKSSLEQGQLRMAIGQLYDYWFRLKGPETDEYLAVLVPEEPNTEQIALLGWLDIGVLWFAEGKLVSGTEWLGDFTANDAETNN